MFPLGGDYVVPIGGQGLVGDRDEEGGGAVCVSRLATLLGVREGEDLVLGEGKLLDAVRIALACSPAACRRRLKLFVLEE